MKKHLAAFVLSITSMQAIASELLMPIRGVTDGDTIKTVVTLPCPLCEVSIRINGIDTPESTKRLAMCEKERLLGIEATEFLRRLVAQHTLMVVTNAEWDKYGGRILGTVYVNGINLGQAMIDAGLAKPYFGSGPKPNWCL